jgi:hypothetical protein
MSVKSPSPHETIRELPTVLVNVKEDLHAEGSVDPVYQAKARVLNHALQEIGMGRYQVRIPHQLFVGEDHIYFHLVESILGHGFRAVRVSVGD